MSKLPVRHYIKNLKLVERNKRWLSSNGVSAKDKFSYYGQVALTYAAGHKKIRYLGSSLYYDNLATPLSLQNYPYEIKNDLLSNMHREPKTVLDIGGNLGQFALTINYMLSGEVKIDTFEPNNYVFEFLKKNTSGKDNIRIYNYGLGDKDFKATLHFDPTRTAIGSIMKENAGIGADMEQEISITSNPQRLTKRKKYDLVKIDVEGYEMHATKGLAGIECEYLFIEFSGQARGKDYMHSELFGLLLNQWGPFDICHCGAFENRDVAFDVLIRFKK